MGAGASSQNDQNRDVPDGNLFGTGSAADAMRNGHALSANQLQMLINAGRMQYGNGGRGGSNNEMENPAPNFRSAKVAKNPFNLKKGSLRLEDGESEAKHVEFTFDALEDCEVTILYFVREYVTPAHLTVKFEPEPGVSCASITEPVRFQRGANQKFTATMTSQCPFLPSIASPELLHYSERSTCYPLIVDIRSLPSANETRFEDRTAQTTFATVNQEDNSLKLIKQKVSVAGCAYELHDIYGISASAGDEKSAAADADDGDSLCVICLSGKCFFFLALMKRSISSLVCLPSWI